VRDVRSNTHLPEALRDTNTEDEHPPIPHARRSSIDEFLDSARLGARRDAERTPLRTREDVADDFG
jgi:hypothetical protein